MIKILYIPISTQMFSCIHFLAHSSICTCPHATIDLLLVIVYQFVFSGINIFGILHCAVILCLAFSIQCMYCVAFTSSLFFVLFLLLSRISVYRYTTFCLSFHIIAF